MLTMNWLCLLLLVPCVVCDPLLTVSGHVKAAFEGPAPDLSLIELALYTPHGSKRDSTDCAPKTGYFFIPVQQKGQYLLKVLSPPGWCVEPSEVSVKIGEQEVEEKVFILKGFVVSGSIVSEDKGVEGIDLTLVHDGMKNEVLQVQTDKHGHYSFKNVPPGKVTVNIGQESLKAYSFSEKAKSFQVKEDQITLQPFVVMGYDVEGKVTDAEGSPVEKVTVLIYQGERELSKRQTDKMGAFGFANVSRGDYGLAVQGQIEFDQEKKDIQVLDKNVLVGSIVLKNFALQGQVVWHRGDKTGIGGVEVFIDQVDSPVITDKHGAFTTKVKHLGRTKVRIASREATFEDQVIEVLPSAGIHYFYPDTLRVSGSVERHETGHIQVVFESKGGKYQAEVSREGKFETFLPPKQHYSSRIIDAETNADSFYVAKMGDFNLNTRPIDAISFKIARFTVSGALNCSPHPCKETKVQLVGTEGKETVTDKEGTFQFDQVGVGKYSLKVLDESRCWEEKERTLVVQQDEQIQLNENGFAVTVKSTHATILRLVAKDKTIVERIPAGKTNLCVSANELYDVFTDGCTFFDISPSQLDVSSLQTLQLRAKAFLVKGEIQVTEEANSVSLKSLSSHSGETKVELKKQNGALTFEIQVLTEEQVTLVPSSNEAFFLPSKIAIVLNDNCQDNFITFKVRKGLFQKGRIIPPVEGVLVKVTGLTVEAVSKKDGTFQLGPFEEEKRHNLILTKEGYSFKELSDGTFRATTLSSLSISVKDKAHLLLEEAVVSVSSDNGYRASGPLVEGTTQFKSLLPGDYFVKVHLKEWAFSPKHATITIKENQELHQEFSSERIYFSLFGRILYLNGAPASQMVVIAKGTETPCEDEIEDSVTDKDGQFRLRGLTPQCKYQLSPGGEKTTFVSQTVQILQRQDQTLKEDIFAKEIPDTFHIGVQLRSLEMGERMVTVRAYEEERVIMEKRFSVDLNQVTVLPPMPVLDAKYSLLVEKEQIKNIEVRPGEIYYAKMEIGTTDDIMRRDQAGSFLMLIPISIALICVFLSKKVFPTMGEK